jgi:hypothetical protein
MLCVFHRFSNATISNPGNLGQSAASMPDHLPPWSSSSLQNEIGADIIMALDDVVSLVQLLVNICELWIAESVSTLCAFL